MKGLGKIQIALLNLLLFQVALAEKPCISQRTDACASSQGFTQIFERLKQVSSSGDSMAYQLTGTPLSQFPLRVFRDGLELQPGTDFRLEGLEIVVYGRNAEARGNLFQASYTVKASESRSSGNRTSEQARRVVRAYLEDALSSELNLTEPDTPVASRRVPDRYQPEQGRDEVEEDTFPRRSSRSSETESALREPSSFRMLDAMNAQHASEARNVRRNRKHSAVAIGLEGIGDTYTPSPFDRSDLTRDDATRRVSSNRRQTNDEREPASERMLRNLNLSTY